MKGFTDFSCCGRSSFENGGLGDWLGLDTIIGEGAANFFGDLATTGATIGIKAGIGELVGPSGNTTANSGTLQTLYLQSQQPGAGNGVTQSTADQNLSQAIAALAASNQNKAAGTMPSWAIPAAVGAGVLILLVVLMKR